MSEEKPPIKPKDEHGCIIDKETWNEDTQKCEPIETKTSPPAASEAVKAAQISDAAPLIDRIMNVMSEVMNKKLSDFEKKIDGKIDTILKGKEVEIEQALRKGFGLENDPVVHMSDMIEYGRKLALDKAETAKRTPGAETPGGPDGNLQLSEVDKMFAKAKKGELA